MENIKKQVFEALDKGELYDYIANNYYEMSKEELKDVLLETLYCLYYEGRKPGQTFEDTYKENQQVIASELSDRWDIVEG